MPYMRVASAIVMVLCGTLLILAPAAFELIRQQIVLNAERHPSFYDERLGGIYMLVCWIIGAALLAVASLVLLLTRQPNRP